MLQSAKTEVVIVATTLTSRPLVRTAPTPRRRALILAALAASAGLLVVLPRVPGEVGIKATGVVVAFVALIAESLPFLLVGAAIVALLQGAAGRRLFSAARGHPRLATALAPLSGA